MTSEDEFNAIHRAIDEELAAQGKRRLTGAESSILWHFFSQPGIGFKQIANETIYTYGSIRDAAYKLYTKIKIITGKDVKQNTCAREAKAWYQKLQVLGNVEVQGREKELNTLLSDVRELGRHVICITGAPKIGKTQLAIALCRQLLETVEGQKSFDDFIRCPVSSLKSVEDLCRYIDDSLPTDIKVPQGNANLALTRFLHEHRYILLIEQGEVLHDIDSLEGHFKSESSSYERWLRDLMDAPDLRGCLIWVSRVPPSCLQEINDYVVHHQLQTLTQTVACNILIDKGLDKLPPQELEHVADFCGNNPGALKIAAHKIKNRYGYSVAEFINDPLDSDDAGEYSWYSALDNISSKERSLLGWLLLYPHERVKARVDRVGRRQLPFSQLGLVIQSLQKRGLIDIDEDGYCFIQSLWLRHVVAKHLVERLGKVFERETIATEDVHKLNQHPLISPQAPAWQRQWHRKNILGPLAEYLIDKLNLWSNESRAEKINYMLQFLKRGSINQPPLQNNYAAGNLINIAIELGIPLKDLTFDGLTIRHADLRLAKLKGANFGNCNTRGTSWPVILREPVVSAMSPDGNTVAVGDSEGWILCWQREIETFVLYDFAQITNSNEHPMAITHIAFGNEKNLAIAADGSIYRWFLYPEEKPELIDSIPSPISSLACGDMDFIAIGLENGCIWVWNNINDSKKLLAHHHMNAVEILEFNAEATQLASEGGGDRILVWDLFGTSDALQNSINLADHYYGMKWQQDSIVVAGLVRNRSCQIRSTAGSIIELPYDPQGITGILFSENGNYLAAGISGKVEIWSVQQELRLYQIPLETDIRILALSNDGTWVLKMKSNSPAMVQLWSIPTGKIYWEQTATSVFRQASTSDNEGYLQLSNDSGPTAVEKAYYAALGFTA
ncbi:hypothetical protein [Adonisia turfae]|uniref:NB-ARC domain-containing protein n=1 Tax=Adonisia turfae CCMR0081 TaxID=2292702 RepID=A0A6M0RCU2_9CYAN|nr:hypothetical protein [Adonisia turfae]NEZ54127.1 hypothetical protein [Adonisia turfae CCMR0081]